jgi:hypothetical protein
MNGNNFTVLENNEYSLSDLLRMIETRDEVMIDTGRNLVCGWVVGIREEDGSGKCWLVTIRNKYSRQEVFIRTK